MRLSNCVTIARQFQRSVRLDTDIGVDEALRGYICHSSARHALETLGKQFKEGGQRAFTWTGPFGGGKSSLAVVLATYLAGEKRQRALAGELLGKATTTLVRKSLGVTDEPWLVVPVVGHKADLTESLRASIDLHLPKNARRQFASASNGRHLASALGMLSESRPKSGVLVIFDELGKFLEHAASTNGDIHFLQDLAEGAARSKGRLLVVGILHQTFEQYAVRLGHSYRDEWAKIQGRFADIPVIASLDETVDLIGRAITASCKHAWSRSLSKAIATSIKNKRRATPEDLSDRLDACWPLHPVTAALLGPASKRRFGQNERSTFSFLSTPEPLGFKEYLETTETEDQKTYEPSLYWDYLKANLEPAILASPDGHRWSLAADAVERSEAKGGSNHVRLMKSIAVLDLFRNGSGLGADREVLQTCVPDCSRTTVDRLLSDLEAWSVSVHRKHLGSWTVFSGSDFDIEGAVRTVLAQGVDLRLSDLSSTAGLSSIVAKRLYHESGTLRWFHSEMCSFEDLEKRLASFSPVDGAAGLFLVVLPPMGEARASVERVCKEVSARKKRDYPLVLGVPANADVIVEFASELVALQKVKRESPELEGDGVARRELTARIGDVSARLEDELRAALSSATWLASGEVKRLGATGLTGLATEVAKSTYPDTVVIQSEMVNRHRPSSNTQAAVRQLMWAMVKSGHIEKLSFESFSAERGLFATTLEATGLHGEERGAFSFRRPQLETHQPALVKLWDAGEKLLRDGSSVTPIGDVYEEWLRPPFGLRKGLLPILGLAFILSNMSRIAVYRQGMYQPTINELLADVLLQDPSLIGVRLVSKDDSFADLVDAYAAAIQNSLAREIVKEPLEISRALVGFAFALTPWARRTTSLSNHAQGIRRLLLDANDPHRLLFVDIPMLFGMQDPGVLKATLADALSELSDAYECMLRDIQSKMLSALDAADGEWDDIARRSAIVIGATGDLRLDAFAVRLSTYSGQLEQLEGVVSMAINRPPRDWSDRDPDAAALELANLALRFRQAEVLAAVKGRAPTRQAIGLVIGTGESGRASLASFDVSEAEHQRAQKLAEMVLETLRGTGLPTNVLLASIAEASGELMRSSKPSNEY